VVFSSNLSAIYTKWYAQTFPPIFGLFAIFVCIGATGGFLISKTGEIMIGDITSAALRQCQRASKVISPFIIFDVFDVSFRRYKL